MNLFTSKTLLLSLFITLHFSTAACGQENDQPMKPEDTEWYEPVPPVITPGGRNFPAPPADAIVLFDGSSMNKWKSSDGGEVPWNISNNAVTIAPGTGDIETVDSFGDFQLYIEWRIPKNAENEGQAKGNSGIFL